MIQPKFGYIEKSGVKAIESLAEFESCSSKSDNSFCENRLSSKRTRPLSVKLLDWVGYFWRNVKFQFCLGLNFF